VQNTAGLHALAESDPDDVIASYGIACQVLRLFDEEIAGELCLKSGGSKRSSQTLSQTYESENLHNNNNSLIVRKTTDQCKTML